MALVTQARMGSHAVTLFNGSSQFASVASAFNFTSGAFSVAFWLKLDSLSTPSSGQGPVIFYKGQYNTSGYYLQIQEAGTLIFVTNQSGAAQASGATETLATGKRYHMVLSRNGSVVKV